MKGISCVISLRISVCTRCIAAKLHLLYYHYVKSLDKDNNSDTSMVISPLRMSAQDEDRLDALASSD